MTDHTIVLYDHDKSPADLVAEAIVLCEAEKALATHDLVMAKTRKQIKVANTRHAMVTTHLAEFEDWKNESIEQDNRDRHWMVDLYDELIATKAKRLLRRE